MERKKLPVGIEDFSEFSRNGFYYADKTMFIAELLNNWGKVNLFTRPRRFGKSLNMSMLKNFFETGADKTLFHGLKISQEKELCENYMGKFPVISLSLKSVDGTDFRMAVSQLRMVMGTEAERFSFLAKSGVLTDNEREKYRALISMENGSYNMSDVVLTNSLQTLSFLLSKHYGQKTIILIDEYDVPLDKAFQGGYYDSMVVFIRNLLGNALKSNDSLQFAVLTGCLRISKESIFTGLNNMKVHGITDVRYHEYFGFTQQDVKELLSYYGQLEHAGIIREWYNGYQFGNLPVYCPWDVINYCDALLTDPDAEPENYWVNTSGNGMVQRFIRLADQQTRDEIEQLIAGASIVKEINQELTYSELDRSIDNLWSVLFTTGYLTAIEKISLRTYRLIIPNAEIRDLFICHVREWFKEKTIAEPKKLQKALQS